MLKSGTQYTTNNLEILNFKCAIEKDARMYLCFCLVLKTPKLLSSMFVPSGKL